MLKRLTKKVKDIHKTMPRTVGKIKAKAVHLKLPVSFLIVRQEVAHGK